MKHYIANQKEKNPVESKKEKRGFRTIPKKGKKSNHYQLRKYGVELFLDQMKGTKIIKSFKLKQYIPTR